MVTTKLPQWFKDGVIFHLCAKTYDYMNGKLEANVQCELFFSSSKNLSVTRNTLEELFNALLTVSKIFLNPLEKLGNHLIFKVTLNLFENI